MKKGLTHIDYCYKGKKEKYLKVIGILLFVLLYAEHSIGQNTKDTTENTLLNNTKSQDISKQKTLADSLVVLCNSYIKKGNFTEALSTIETGLGIYEMLNDNKQIGNCHNTIALIFYYQGNYGEALSYYDQSIFFYKKAAFKRGITSSINNIGAIYYYLGNYPKALDHYKQAAKINETLNDKKQTAATIQNIGGIYVELNDYENAMVYFQIAKKTFEDISEEKSLSQVLNAIGEIYLKKQKYSSALNHFEEALHLAKKTSDKQRILETVFNLGEIYGAQKNYEKSLSYYDASLRLAKKIKNTLYISQSLIAIGSINYRLGEKKLAISNCKKGLEIAKSIKTVSAQEEGCKCLYSAYKSLDRKGMALAYFEESITLKDSLQARQTADKILNMEFEKEMLLDSISNVQKERKVQIKHKQEVAAKETQKKMLGISGGFLLLFAIGLWSRLKYTKKSKTRLQIEKDRSEHLLLNILPEEIAEELKEKGYVDAQDFESASILFTDFKSFTETAAKLSPQELVEEINTCFKAFDAIMEYYNIEKIKTIGDAYMAAGGLPKPDVNAVKKTILAALEMQEFISQRRLENSTQNKPAFEMRVGVHVGPIIAGIVGVKKFQYDIWGDTVNIASRMESNSAIGKVNISHDTYELIKNEADFIFEFRGKIVAKGKGEMEMYFVDRAV